MNVQLSYIFETILPPLIVLFGLVGNIITFIVFSRKKFEKVAMIFLFRVMTVTDSIALIQCLQAFFKYSSFQFDVSTLSEASCKFFIYFKYAVAPVKGWILVVIAARQYFSVKKTGYDINLFKFR